MTTTERCKICLGFYRVDAAGRLPAHANIKTGRPCRGRWPRKRIEDYPIGYDSEPWVFNGGLMERSRSKH